MYGFDIDVSGIISDTFDKICRVERPTVVTVDGLDEYRNDIVYDNLSCAISGSAATINTTDTVQHINYTHKLFIAPNIVIKEGDEVTVDNTTYVAGTMRTYDNSHAETMLNIKGLA